MASLHICCCNGLLSKYVDYFIEYSHSQFFFSILNVNSAKVNTMVAKRLPYNKFIHCPLGRGLKRDKSPLVNNKNGNNWQLNDHNCIILMIIIARQGYNHDDDALL